jgi:acyl-coenzyme A synthetase/AMP-(fatty) acid ligase
MNIARRILGYAKTRPDAEALIDGGRSITYGELAELVSRTSAHLGNLGLTARDRVGVCLKDTADYVLALLAIARLGAVAVPLDWRARPVENARLIAAAAIKLVLIEHDSPPLAACPSVALDRAWHRAIAQGKPQDEWSSDWHEPFIISASSGSTDAAKLTLMTHLQYHFAMVGMLELLGLSGRHRYLNTAPLYYAHGRNSCIAHLLRGDCVILYPSLFDGAEYIEVARRYRATVGVVVPTMLRRLLALKGFGTLLLPELSALFCGGAPLHPEEKHEALRHLTPNFQPSYGTSETLVISVLRPEAIAERADSVGQPHSLAELEVVDDEDRPLPAGAAGRLRYRAPGLASPLPGTGAEAAFRGGWFYPGEIAQLDKLGYIFLKGRASEVIVRSGGVKVHPTEVEQVLCGHRDIIEAAVIGQTIAEEEQIVAFLVARREIARGELIAHCRSHLTPHKVPRHFHFLTQLPKNTSGKVDKLALAQALMQAK